MWQTYWLSIQTQAKSLFRLPAYWVPTALFPVMLYSMFGAGGEGVIANYRLASFVIYGVIGVGFYQFGVSIAQDRESHWERFRRVLPGALSPRLAAQAVAALIFILISAALVITAAFFLSAPSISAGQILGLMIVALFVALPFTLLGIALGYWTNAKSAVAVANLIYLPMAYLGGLWLPPDRLPDSLAAFSTVMPTRHAGELAWAAVGAHPLPMFSILWLIGYALLFAGIAYWGYQRDERIRYA